MSYVPHRLPAVCLMTVLTSLLCSPPALAQEKASKDDLEIIRRVDEARYYPQAPKHEDQVALEDLTLKFKNPRWDDDPLFRNLQIFFYWKQPRFKKFDIVGLPKAYEQKLEESRIQQFQFMIELIVKRTFEDSLGRTPITVLRDAKGEPLQPIQLERLFPEEHSILKEVYTIDENWVPVKVVTYRRDAAITISQDQRFTQREDGTYLLDQIETRAPNIHEVIDLEYETTEEGIDVTTKIEVRNIPTDEQKEAGAEETVTVYDFEIVGVNTGLSDEMFKPQ